MNVFDKPENRLLDLRCRKWNHDTRDIAYCINPSCPSGKRSLIGSSVIWDWNEKHMEGVVISIADYISPCGKRISLASIDTGDKSHYKCGQAKHLTVRRTQ
jgi:hypothetical protein